MRLNVVGGGLAGCEAAWQAAQLGASVTLYEMRPGRQTPAHKTGLLSELVCSNSLGSRRLENAAGLLKEELRRLGSVVIDAADSTAVPAGQALAVDREAFAQLVTQRVEYHPRIRLIREIVSRVPDEPTIIATGPLTSDGLATDIARFTGEDNLYFFDALSPIVTADSIDLSVAFRQSRYDRGETDAGDYINCPLDKSEYAAFVGELLRAERIELHEFETEDERYFEGCLPIEVLAGRGAQALAYGPMRPVGLTDPRTGQRPYAVVQLRRDDAAGALYNLVGFQTNIRWPEQQRILRLIPGLEAAEFVRLGQMHRNTYLNAPLLLEPTMEFGPRAGLFFAGQICGIEGYCGNVASGLVAGVNAARALAGRAPLVPPPTTLVGALCRYVREADPRHFQPMKSNFGLLPPLATRERKKQERHRALAARSLATLVAFLAQSGWQEPTGEPVSAAR